MGWGLISSCSCSIWRRSNYFLSIWTVAVFDPGGNIIFWFTVFPDHFGRSKAWNSTHHGRYVFLSLRSAASLSISSLSVCLCCACCRGGGGRGCRGCGCVCLCVSVFLVVFGASAMKVNAWTWAPATASDLESALRIISIRTRRMVNCAWQGHSQVKLWWSCGTDVQVVRCTSVFGAKDKPNHLTAGSQLELNSFIRWGEWLEDSGTCYFRPALKLEYV